MFPTVLNVFPQVPVELAQLVVFCCQSGHFFVALIDLVDPEAMGIFGLVQGFGQIVVAHDFCLSAFVIVDGLRLVFFCECTDGGDILLKVGKLVLGIGDLGFEIRDIL